jgi:hypothetical protein
MKFKFGVWGKEKMDLLKKLGMRKEMEREFALVPRLNRIGLSKTYIGSKHLPNISLKVGAMKENLTLQSHYDSSHTSYKRMRSRSKQIVRVQQRVSVPLLFFTYNFPCFFPHFPSARKAG